MRVLSQRAFACSKSTIKTIQQGVKYVQSKQIKHQWRHFGSFIINFEHILHLTVRLQLDKNNFIPQMSLLFCNAVNGHKSQNMPHFIFYKRKNRDIFLA